MRTRILLWLVSSMALLGMASSSMGRAESVELPPLEVVPHVDLNRYLGKWYEIASYPNRFQRGCVASTATYALRQDGNIDVLNECRQDTLDGELRSVHGKAWVVDPATNAKLKVQFFWPFSGAYWVIELGENYEYAVVGHPGRNYLWILSRTPVMSEKTYQGLLDRLQNVHHYDISRLKKTPQS